MSTRTDLRPVVHFTPDQGWMNDPHGVFHVDGTYHLFFQHIPDSVEWRTDIGWGHATSTDLLHWQVEDMALRPGDGDEGIWSGGAVIDDDGRPVLFYSSATGPDYQLSQIRSARLADDGTWVKGPVAVEHVDPTTRVFRDPVVFRDGDRWRMIVGSGRSDGTASADVYSSADLESWAYEGVLATRSTRSQHPWTGTAWECPQVIRTVGDGADVLVVSIWDDHAPHDVAAASGTYADGRFTPNHWRLLSAGAGHFAASAFTDVDGRPCLIFWIRGITDTSRWAGALSIPYVVTAVADDVRLTPHPDVASARVPANGEPGTAIDVEWRPGTEDRLDLVTPEGEVHASITVDGWSVTVGVRDAALVTVNHQADSLRIIADAQVLEVVADGGLVGVPLPGSNGGLAPRATEPTTVAWWHLI